MNIYVGNLPYGASEAEVRKAFAAFGTVASVILIKDSDTCRPRGFGFVEMPNTAEAQEAIRSLHGKTFKDAAWWSIKHVHGKSGVIAGSAGGNS